MKYAGRCLHVRCIQSKAHMHRFILFALLVVLLASQRVQGEEAASRARLEQRLAEQLAAMAQAGENPKLAVPFDGKRIRLPLGGADGRALTLVRDESRITVPWDTLAPLELLGIARATTGAHFERLLLAAEWAIELKDPDQAGEFLTRAYMADPKSIEKVRTLAVQIAPLSGSPLADLRNPDLPSIEAAAIHPGHPRLFLRQEAWGPKGTGLTCAKLRERAQREPWAPFVKNLSEKPFGTAALALKYLATGERAAAEQAVERLQKELSLDETTSDGDAVEEAALAFDWLAHYPEFGAARRQKAIDRIAEAAERIMLQLEFGGHIFHTRMYAWANGSFARSKRPRF